MINRQNRAFGYSRYQSGEGILPFLDRLQSLFFRLTDPDTRDRSTFGLGSAAARNRAGAVTNGATDTSSSQTES